MAVETSSFSYYEKIKNLNTINIAWIDSILATLLFHCQSRI